MFKLSYLCLVLIGGGLGAVARYIATTVIGARFGSTFPFGTFTVNIIGSFLMGFLMMFAISERTTLPEPIRLLCTVGFLGGFTTFSSFSMETVTLFTGGQTALAFLNMGANFCLGLAAVWLGMGIARLITL
jgi:CrcB protein